MFISPLDLKQQEKILDCVQKLGIVGPNGDADRLQGNRRVADQAAVPVAQGSHLAEGVIGNDRLDLILQQERNRLFFGFDRDQGGLGELIFHELLGGGPGGNRDREAALVHIFRGRDRDGISFVRTKDCPVMK